MKIGLVGYQGSGKSTMFHWLTGEEPNPALAHTTQTAMATIPDDRVAGLCDVYKPKKVTLAALEIVDTPGLSRDQEGNPGRLAMIREAGCLVLVAAAFRTTDPQDERRSFEEDLLLTDLEIVSNRMERLREALRKPRPDREKQQAEMEALEPVFEQLNAGRPVRDLKLSQDQWAATRSFQLLTLKPRITVLNLAEDADPSTYADDPEVIAVSLLLEQQLASLPPEERVAFCEEMGVKSIGAGGVVRRLMEVSGQSLFFTAGEKEVRTWLIHQGATALEAADSIHSDLARGFIRAETISCDDLIRLGSEREVKAAGLVRQEPKDYLLRDGDILNIRFSV